MPVGQIHPLHHGHRVSPCLQARQIETMGEKRAFLHVQQVSRRVGGVRHGFHDRLVEASVERSDADGVGRIVRGAAEIDGHVEKVAAVRKKLRIAVGRLVTGSGEDDCPVAVPRPTDASLGVADRQDRPAGRVHAFQLSVREEADRPAVGRPERKVGVLRPDHGTRRGFLEVPDPESGLPARFCGREDESGSVGRHRELAEEHPLGKRESGPDAGLGARGTPHVSRGERDGRDRGDRETDPGEALAALPPRDNRSRHAGGGPGLGDPLELELRVVRGLEPVLRVLGETRLDDPVDGRRNHRRDLRDRRRIVPEN